MLSERILAAEGLTAQRQAYLYIQDQIVSGVLAGGSRLKPEVIAGALGISRMPVREAIRQLDAEGYVTIRPHRGAIVKARSAEEVIELFEIRAALEGLAVRLGAAHASDDALDDLEGEIVRLRRIAANHLAWVDRHDRLHDAFCAAGGRPQLRAECQRFRTSLMPYIRLYLRIHENPERPGYEHEHILDAMRSRDPDRAERVMRAHVMANADGIAQCLRPPRHSNGLLRPEASRARLQAGE